jgi:uncharacterized protein (TIGR03000 family)
MRMMCCSAATVLALGTGLVRAEGGLSGALVGYTSGSPLDRRPIVTAREYSASPYVPGTYGSLASPIFMTTINTPGIYGAYSFGVAPLTLNREPLFYPAYNDREVIPSINVTFLPLRDQTTAAGAPTLNTGTPSTTPDVPGSRALSTIPGQVPAAPAITSPVVPGENVARVVVRVPENAQLEFGGVAVGQTGRVRKFTTPALTPNQQYRYDIRATWTENGRQVVKDRQVFVYAGEKADVDFLGPNDAANEKMDREMRTTPTSPQLNPGVPPIPQADRPVVPPPEPRDAPPPLKPTLPPKRP